MRARYLLPLLVTAIPFRGLACSCFGPSTFCETMNPNYAPPIDPAWWTPDAIVLGVKTAQVGHGMDVLVLQGFFGEAQADDVIRVWGDTGLLCRMYADSWEVGDTVVWALRYTDQQGGAMEQPEDYLISVCGTYWLDYTNDMISGPIFTEGETEQVPVADFGALVNGCLSTGVGEVEAPEVSVRCVGDQILISTSGAWAENKTAHIVDPAGRTLADLRFRGQQGNLPMPSRSNGLLLVRISDGQRTMTRPILVE